MLFCEGLQTLARTRNFLVRLLLRRKSAMRVPNRFFGIRDLAYFKAGIRDFEGNWGTRFGNEIRDCNYDRDTGFGDFNKRESGNVASKKPRLGNSRD